jgi:hypothetical protein
MEEWVFVDTCVWASFFGKPGSPEKAGVDGLTQTEFGDEETRGSLFSGRCLTTGEGESEP